LADAGWLAEAGQDLDRLEKDFPKQGKELKDARDGLAQQSVFQTAQDLKLAYRSGNFKKFEGLQEKFDQLLANFPGVGLPPAELRTIRQMKVEFESAAANIKLAEKFLTDLPEQVEQQDQRALLQDAAKAIVAELTADNVGRLEAFLTQAKQAERQK